MNIIRSKDEKPCIKSKIKVNDVNIYYETYGQGDPIVLISGLASDHTSWQKVIAPYAKQYQVTILDNRGVGQSDCPNYPYTIEMMADDIASLVQVLHKDKAVHFVGSSMGGCIVQTIAYKYPSLTKSIVIANSFTSPIAKSNIRAHLYLQIRLELMKMQVLHPSSTTSTIAKLNGIFGYSQHYLHEPGILDQIERSQMVIDSRTTQNYENQLNAVNTFDSTSWLHSIKTPCLVLASDDDLLASAEQGKQIAGAISGAEYFCFHSTGHSPRLEQPEMFNKLVLDFIAKQRQ